MHRTHEQQIRDTYFNDPLTSDTEYGALIEEAIEAEQYDYYRELALEHNAA